MNNPWRSELWRLLVTVAVSLALGLALGQPFSVLAATLAAYLAWHLYQAFKLLRWLGSGEPPGSPLPQTGGIWREITHRVAGHVRALAERNTALRSQMDRYRQVARALPDAAVTFNRDGEIELINDAARKLLGLREPDDLGRPVKNLIRQPQFVEYMERERYEVPLEITSPADPGINLSITVVPYGDLDKYLLLARDTSRLNRLERMRQDFIANVSHEMKSPLTVIKGYVENLLDDAAAAGKWERALFQIDQQTDRMCSIVEDLLELSNLETGPAPETLQPVDMPALIRSVFAEARELSQGRHQVECAADETLHMLGNFNELYSAFSNVVFNAVSYTDEGGTISIDWRLEPDGRARLSVADTGIGIAPEYIPRLTERFYRVDQARSRELGGTGLGLAIVKHVLARHDGRLEVSSEPGEGSTFTFVFPAELVQIRDGDRAGPRTSAA
ncbi:MAG: phosphate regulon sensor histidine kinase PhoR [Gammaproteobacteria bacterium]|nr:phosphate regulon sensor histidine kinase PhoR [Gammaproteobacteria bacterium]